MEYTAILHKTLKEIRSVRVITIHLPCPQIPTIFLTFHFSKLSINLAMGCRIGLSHLLVYDNPRPNLLIVLRSEICLFYSRTCLSYSRTCFTHTHTLLAYSFSATNYYLQHIFDASSLDDNLLIFTFSWLVCCKSLSQLFAQHISFNVPQYIPFQEV